MTEATETVTAVRCSSCQSHYRLDHDMLSGKFLWFKPKPKRENRRIICEHDVKAEVQLDGGKWVETT